MNAAAVPTRGGCSGRIHVPHLAKSCNQQLDVSIDLIRGLSVPPDCLVVGVGVEVGKVTAALAKPQYQSAPTWPKCCPQCNFSNKKSNSARIDSSSLSMYLRTLRYLPPACCGRCTPAACLLTHCKLKLCILLFQRLSPQPALPKSKIKATLPGCLLPLTTTLPSPYSPITSSLPSSSCFLFSPILLPHQRPWAIRTTARPGAHSSRRISRTWMRSPHHCPTLRRIASAGRPLELECHKW